MATATTTTSGHVARAIRLFNEVEIFTGISITDPWGDESNPDTTDATSINIGKISLQTYSGSSLSSTNTFVTLNQTPFLGGVVNYKITALSATTFEVRNADTNIVVGNSSYTFSATPFTNIVQGLSISVTSNTMTTGQYFTFKVDGPIGFKAVEQKYLVIPDNSGTIDYRGQKWLIVDPSQAYAKGARWVYVMATMRYDELPITDFRQIGVFTGLTRANGVSNSVLALLPSQVASTGALEIIDNRTAITRNVNQKEVLSFIIEN